MFANSREVASGQATPHLRLPGVVARHLEQPFRRPISDVGRAAFAALADRIDLRRPLILDSGCGTGASTLALPRMWPEHVVVGVDKSAARLAIGERLLANDRPVANVHLLRCELVDFYSLAAQAGWRCARHYLLYPNPWPKPAQFKRRWHAHAIFPALLALGGAIELRTNWRVYAQEFAQALMLAGYDPLVERFAAEIPLSPFERKYAASGHVLWRVMAN